MNKILQITWLFSVIAPFLLIDWKWAVIVLLINFIGILPLGILTISVLKPIFGPGHWFLSYAGGISEATLYLLLNRFLNHPDKFLLALIIVYFINQIGRIFRIRFQSDEALILAGFLSLLVLGFVFGWV